MEEEKVSEEYKAMFNLGYVDQKHQDGKGIQGLMDLHEDNPTFKETDTYKALKAGREQAIAEQEKEMSDMYREDLAGKFEQSGNDALKQPQKENEFISSRPLTEDEKNGIFKQPEPENNVVPEQKSSGLSPEQEKELADHPQWDKESKERQAFKEKTRKMQVEGAENSRYVESDESKKDFDKQKKEKEQKQNQEQGTTSQQLNQMAAEKVEEIHKDILDKAGEAKSDKQKFIDEQNRRIREAREKDKER